MSAQQQHDDLLDLAEVMGKRIVSTRLHGNVTIREDNATAALEAMSRCREPEVADLPATHDVAVRDEPCAGWRSIQRKLAYFRHAGVPRVVAEEPWVLVP